MVTPKQTYQHTVNTSANSVIFQSAEWLDIVAGPENWIPLIAQKGNQVTAVMAVVTKVKFGVSQITLPPLTPYLGPIFNYPTDLAEKNKPSFEQKALLQLIDQIPKVSRFITQCDFNFTNWLPFAWNNYKQTTRYSYLLNTSAESQTIFNGFKTNIQKEIKKAKEQFTIVEASSTTPLFQLYKADQEHKNNTLLFDEKLLHQLFQQFHPQKKLTIIHALNNENKVVAAFCLVQDKQYIHYLLGAGDINYRNKGVMSFLMWHAISEAKKWGVTFNFEGSMHQNIGRFFASFGGDLTPYFQISKANHPILKHVNRFHY